MFANGAVERRGDQVVPEAILEGYRDLAHGRLFTSSGNFAADMILLAQREANGWQ